jgi:hypothetical protein
MAALPDPDAPARALFRVTLIRALFSAKRSAELWSTGLRRRGISDREDSFFGGHALTVRIEEPTGNSIHVDDEIRGDKKGISNSSGTIKILKSEHRNPKQTRTLNPKYEIQNRLSGI